MSQPETPEEHHENVLRQKAAEELTMRLESAINRLVHDLAAYIAQENDVNREFAMQELYEMLQEKYGPPPAVPAN